MKPASIILASQSPARKRLLKRLGYRFRAVPAQLDEESFHAKSPKELVRMLAREKARVVAENFPRDIVIGSDQMLVLGKTVFGKPHTVENAMKQLRACAGKTVELLTAVTVLIPPGNRSRQQVSKEVSFLDVTKLKFLKLSHDEIERYVGEDSPLECAGSFMFERAGIRLFARIETSDPTAIEGLPCVELNAILRHAQRA